MAAPAWAVDLWMNVKPYYDRIAVWRGYEAELQTLAIYGVGIAVYATLVYTFYNNISRRQPFHIPLSDRRGWIGGFSRFFERAFVFPLTSFLYFTFLAVALFVLAKEGMTSGRILLVSMAVIVAIRVAVYVNQGISSDISKLVPLSLLGVLLVDPGYLKLATAWTRVGEAVQMWPLLGRYFLLFIALEAGMGMTRALLLNIRSRIRRARGQPDPAPAAEPVRTLTVKEGQWQKPKAP